VLKDEIAVLKGGKKRPRFKASGMEKKAGQEEKASEAGDKKRAGSEKRSKTALLEIHEERVIAPEAIPAGSRFKGYEDYVVQGLIIRAHNTRYRLERWQTPAGETLLGELPEAVRGQHFSPELQGYILYTVLSGPCYPPAVVRAVARVGCGHLVGADRADTQRR
jgi:hypothetical protein